MHLKWESPGKFLRIALAGAAWSYPSFHSPSLRHNIFASYGTISFGAGDPHHGPDTKLCAQRRFKATGCSGFFIILLGGEMEHILFSPWGKFLPFPPSVQRLLLVPSSHNNLLFFPIYARLWTQTHLFLSYFNKNYWHKPYKEWLRYNWLCSRWVIILIKRNGKHRES